jgi:hypothetical protein
MATRKVRYKKLSVKTLLGVLREEQIDPAEYESLTNEAQIATGVEQAEENVSRNLSSSRMGHVSVHVPHIHARFWRGLILTLMAPGIPSPSCLAERGGRR